MERILRRKERESFVLTLAKKKYIYIYIYIYLRSQEQQGRGWGAKSGIKTLSEQFGRGWAWLLKHEAGMEIENTPS